MVRWVPTLVALLALVLAGAAAWLALDARRQADELQSQNSALRERLAAFRPTLVVQQRSDDPFNAPRARPDGSLENISMYCPRGSVVVGGGFNGFDGVTIAGTTPLGGNGGRTAHDDGWLVNAVNENGGRGRVAPAALCARGEGGLRVRSTADSNARGKRETP